MLSIRGPAQCRRPALGDRHVLAVVGEHLDIENWQVLAVDNELRLPLTRLAMAQRTAFIRAALAEAAEPE